MIQKAHFIADKEEIIRLWQKCFGDSRHYVEFFLKNCPSENALFLYCIEDINVGMMLLMPGELVWADRRERVYYLYALCVDENYRHRGIAGELLDFAKAFAKDNNAEVCLVPSSEELRRYYAKRGFLDVFVRTEQRIDVDGQIFPLKPDIKTSDIHLLMEKRAKTYAEASFLWDRDNFEFAIKENAYSGGFAYLVSPEAQEGVSAETYADEEIQYIIGDIENDVLQIRETNLKRAAIHRLAAEYNCSKICFLNIKNPLEEYTVRNMPYAMMTNQVFTEEFIRDTRFYERYINFCFD